MQGTVPRHTRRLCCPSKPATPGGPRSPSLCPVPCFCLPQGPSVFCLPVSLSASSWSLCLPSLLPLAPLQFSLALYTSTLCLTVSLLLPVCPFLSPPNSLLPLSPLFPVHSLGLFSLLFLFALMLFKLPCLPQDKDFFLLSPLTLLSLLPPCSVSPILCGAFSKAT